MSGYPGYQGNVTGGPGDLEMGQPGGSDARFGQMPTAAFAGQAAYAQGYGQPQQQGGYPPVYPPQAGGKPAQQQYQPQYAGYGGQAASGGGYTAPQVQQPPPPPPGPSQYIADMDQAVRHGFIRKVYGILIVQLLLTFGIVAIFSYIDAVQVYAMNNSWLMGVSIAAVFVLLIGMTCCPGNLMSKFPLNIILLMVFSLFQGVALGVIAASFACDARAYDSAKGLVVCVNNPDAPAVNGRMSVLLAMAITIGVVLVLTIFACQTKYDFTGAGPYLMAALLIFIVFFAIAGIWLRFDKVYNLVYACIGVLVFSALLIYNTQLIVGGKNRKYQLGPDQYIFGALTLYLDIINIFLFVLSIIGLSR